MLINNIHVPDEIIINHLFPEIIDAKTMLSAIIVFHKVIINEIDNIKPRFLKPYIETVSASIYKGYTYPNGWRHGNWVKIASPIIIKYSYVNGVKQGLATHIDIARKTTTKFNYLNGKKQGIWRKYHTVTDLPIEERNYTKGILDGEVISYNMYGNKKHIATYNGTYLHGPLTQYQVDGSIISVKYYDMDVEVSYDTYMYNS